VRLLSASLLSLAIASAFGQTYTINTIAGGGLPVNLAATSVSLGEAPGVAIDPAGNVLVSLTNYNMVVRIDAATGNLTPIAGNGIAGYGGDYGAADSAQLNGPQGIAVDSSGNLYIADAVNNVIRKVSNGTITTFAGGGTLVYPNGVGDGGPATGGYLSGPYGVAVDSAGNVYIADTFNNRVRKVSTGKIITTIAGTGYAGSSGDSGLAASAAVNNPQGVAVDSAGNIYIADTYNSRVRQISTGGIITTGGGHGNPRLQRRQRPGRKRPGGLPARRRGGLRR
jgi:sugar lactone lactonase YvrE